MTVPTNEPPPLRVREVWAHNLHSEFKLLRQVMQQYPCVALDTEFPGVVVKQQWQPYTDEYSRANSFYQTLRANVDSLKLIQLGLTFTDVRGRFPLVQGTLCAAWQFNFREFDVHKDPSAPDSISLLKQSGIDFDKNKRMGIDSAAFAALLLRSGLVNCLSRKANGISKKQVLGLHFISFHGVYDFAYLVKALSGGQKLPAKPEDFLSLLDWHFGTFYDLKYMMRFCHDLHGGLNRLAEALHVKHHIGGGHQAGSDSFVTSLSFHRIRDARFQGSIGMYSGVLYSLEF